MPRRIAYVEDDDTTRGSYCQMLGEYGFNVTAYSSKENAIEAFRQDIPDLALLDVSHAGERDAGYQICIELRRLSSAVPIIFLTSNSGEVDKISGLRLGADDYITKDASIEYIVVRIEALFRRLDAIRSAYTGSRENEGHGTPAKDIDLNETLSTACWKGTEIDLPLTHFWMLKELCINPGQVRSHRELMKAANIVVEQNTITAHIKTIRDAFTSTDPGFRCIKTERGRGYRWVP